MSPEIRVRWEVVVEAHEIRSSCEIKGVEYVFLRWEDEGAGGNR